MSVSLVLVYQWKWCSQDIHWGSYQQRITWQEKKNKLNFNWRHRLRYGGYCPRIFFLKGRPSTSPVCFSDYLSVWLLPSTLVRSSNIIEARQSLAGVVFGISSLWTPSKSGRPACPLVSRCRCFGGGGPKLGATWPNMNSIATEKTANVPEHDCPALQDRATPTGVYIRLLVRFPVFGWLSLPVR